MSKHTLYYTDLNPPSPAPQSWPWVLGTLSLYAAIGALLAWRG